MTHEEARQILAGITRGATQEQQREANIVWRAHAEEIRLAGTNLDIRAKANGTSTLAQLQRVPGIIFEPEWEAWHFTGHSEGPQRMNPSQYATEATAQWLAENLGGDAELDVGVSSGPFPRDPWWLVVLEGERLHAGRLAERLVGLQVPYRQALANYERLLRGALVGTGMLHDPVDPVERLGHQLAEERENAAEETPSARADSLRGAITRGWTHAGNTAKVVDADLVNAIASEVVMWLAERETVG